MGTYRCIPCDKPFDTERKVKQHITMKKDEQHGDQQGVAPGNIEELVARPEDQEDDDDQDLDDLEAGELDFDDPEAREYECGECGGAVEYLTNECPNCGERLAWGAV